MRTLSSNFEPMPYNRVMMTQFLFVRRRSFSLLQAVAVGALFAFAGCQPSGRTESTRTTTGTASSDATDSMATSDAERARAAMEENRDKGRARRPAAPRDREGSRVVDQPRIGRP
jgi:hypothetical protein